MSDLTSPRGREMLGYIPRYYDTSRVMRAILQADGVELDELRRALDETLAQMFVQTATWGLDIWEAELGIKTDSSKPAAERRSNIIAKLRRPPVTNIAAIKRIAEAYTGGRVEITDRALTYTYDTVREVGCPAYTIVIHWIDLFGIPPNLPDLQAVIEEIKPAHLAVIYDFRYLIWDVLDAQNLTWDELDALNLTWAEFESGQWLN